VSKYDIVKLIVPNFKPAKDVGTAFAPTNIALIKYWGKRNQELNLPMTSSLSISLADHGAHTAVSLSDADTIQLNGDVVDASSAFAKRLIQFLNLFRGPGVCFNIAIQSNVPIAAGLASSACGFASIVKALNDLYQWDLNAKSLSILARLGSGSACRSLWDGFVLWHAGVLDNGMDSYGEVLEEQWPDLRVGLLLIDTQEKSIGSRAAMQRTVDTSILYRAWPQKVSHDMPLLRQAISCKNFQIMGEIAESNALAMHATMLSASPSICYTTPETLMAMQKIWRLRAQGLSVYYTQDAGPNLKLLFLQKDHDTVIAEFNDAVIINPFSG